jgi:hypothetical protein
MAIDQLKVTTADLTRRMDNLEYKVDSLVYKVDTISNVLDDMTKLSLVANLVDRIRQSLYDGYDVLKDIIHCSLLGQTSPLLLPSDQLELVQNEVRKKSTGIFYFLVSKILFIPSSMFTKHLKKERTNEILF